MKNDGSFCFCQEIYQYLKYFRWKFQTRRITTLDQAIGLCCVHWQTESRFMRWAIICIFLNAFENEYWLYEILDQSLFWLKVKRSTQKHCDYFSFISTPDNFCCYFVFQFYLLINSYLFNFFLNSDFFSYCDYFTRIRYY